MISCLDFFLSTLSTCNIYSCSLSSCNLSSSTFFQSILSSCYSFFFHHVFFLLAISLLAISFLVFFILVISPLAIQILASSTLHWRQTYHHIFYPKPSGKLRRLTPSFGSTLAVRPKFFFFLVIKLFCFSR